MERTFEVVVESLDLEGRGVAHRDGKVAFIDGALPGERIVYEVTKSKPRYETGRTLAVLAQSASRVTPRCAFFGFAQGACGGCAMQHLEISAQVAIKQRAFEDALWHLGRVRAEMMLPPIFGAAWGYRHRARLSVRHVARKGGALVGFRERSSSHVADMSRCHVLPPRVSDLLLPLRALINGLSIYDRLPQIEVAVGGAGQERADAIVLVMRVLEPPSEDDRNALTRFASDHCVSVWLQPGGPSTATPMDGRRDVLGLDLPEFGVRLPFEPTDFTQVNAGINQVLVSRAVRLLAPRADDVVVDFFCGLGNFTLPLATRSRRVIGLEGADTLVNRAREAAERNGLAARTSFRACNLFEWSRENWDVLRDAHGAIGAVLVDPPREGALAIARVLAETQHRPRRMVYVSCNPATLARDAAVLVHEGGWRLRAAGVVNMFPHTAHVESMAVFDPNEAATPRTDPIEVMPQARVAW
jgi:23S rRNA (uracil1939-C5)-methyltransferase